MRLIKTLSLAILSAAFVCGSVYSQATPRAGQTSGGILQQEQQIEKSKKLEKEIKSPIKKPEEVKTEKTEVEDTGAKVLVKKITVEGSTLITKADIEKVTKQYEGKELSIKGLQKIADLITDEYRKKNFLTSRAYIPAQTIKDGILIIKVVEGKVGSIKIEGNKWFKTSLIRKNVTLKENSNFDYAQLQKSLTYLNELPDRNAKAVLVPGQQAGTTDVVIQVKDRLPIHVGFEYDNYGSRFIDNDRWMGIVEHNNLFGFDDKLYASLQMSEYSAYKLRTFRYLFPFNRNNELGFYYAYSKVKLLGDFEAVDSRGTTELYSAFYNRVLHSSDNADVRYTLGFDYKHIHNYLLGTLSSRDDTRVFKNSLDINLADKWGRTIINPEIDAGVPGMFGGLHYKDPISSRGDLAGGKFVKGTMNLFRLQPGPFQTAFLWKNQMQYSNYNLVAAEQFQIGGPTSVRGYPPAEFTGDEGYYTSIEWSIPFYFIPKKLTVPMAKNKKLYDALRFVTFYDRGVAHLHTPAAGEKKYTTLKSWGYGLRLNLNENLTARVEVGYPLGKKPTDGKNAHPWVEVTSKF